MRINTKIIYQIVTFFFIIALIVNCKKEEPYDQKQYYDIMAKGYVFFRDSLKPCRNSEIEVVSYYGEGGNIFTPNLVREYYTTDSNGCYQIRFIKRTHREDIKSYYINVNPSLPSPPSSYLWNSINSDFKISVGEVKNSSKTILIDTTYIYLRSYP